MFRRQTKTMRQGSFTYKYIVIAIVLALVFFGGLNYKKWHAVNHKAEKQIVLIYSTSKNDTGNGHIEELLSQEFRRQGIKAVFDRFYLNCHDLNEQEETEHIRTYLSLLESKPVDLILTLGDQAAHTVLSTRHRLLSAIPTVACNVRFPDEKLIEEYDSQPVFVLRDIPDLKRNIDFIQSLHPRLDTEIIYNIDLSPQGRQSFDRLAHVVARKNVRTLGYQEAFEQEQEYKQLEEMTGYFNLMPGFANDSIKRNELTVSLCPFRYIRGAALLVILEKSKREQQDLVFLLDKFDRMAIPIVNALNIPAFSCIREGFDENAKIVGGYMASAEISAGTAAELAGRLMKREKTGEPKIRDLKKEYVLDWTYFSEYADDIRNLPDDVRIINYPFYDRYRKELYILGGVFVLAFIFISVSLLRTHRRSLMERRNLQMLEEAHKRLSQSTSGGKISLWNIQEGVLVFDDNHAQLAGLEQRRFTQEEFLQYTHPDDGPLLSPFYEKPSQSSGMKIQRIRFRFSRQTDDYLWYELRCSSLTDAQGEVMVAGIMQNIQEAVEREQQLILAKQIAEKAELKQSFLNNMSHEIRTPLNAIVGFTNLLAGEESEGLSPEEKAGMLTLIHHNNDLLLKLINDVLEISRLDSGSLSFQSEPCDMTQIVQEIYLTYSAVIEPPLYFVLELDGNIPIPVDIDRFRFTQVISNFLTNANKFTREGTITLGCRTDPDRNEVRVYVQDTGKGIDPEELIMIFERFYKTDEFEQGSGLGLPICQVIVDRLGGRIEVESAPGKGSCFAVILPLADTAADRRTAPKENTEK